MEEEEQESYNIKLSKNDINIIFQFLKKGNWENVNDTIQSIYSQKTQIDVENQNKNKEER